MRTRLHLGFSTAVVLLLLHACGGSSSDDDDGDVPSAGTSIGTSGGDVNEAGLTLSIPSGAVSTPVTITVEETSTVTAPAGLVLVGPAYDLGPDGTQFTKPVLVTIELSSAAADYEQVTLYHSSNGMSWSLAENSDFDAQTAVVTGFIRHFSFVAPFAATASSGAGGAPSTGGGGAGGAPGTGTGGEPQAGGVPGVPAGGVGGEPSGTGEGGGSAGESSACGGDLTDCEGACVDLSSDPAHCNDCNYSCALGELCYLGQCTSPQGFCGDNMVNGTEQCDDGNNTNADGCSATCLIEGQGG